jgi:hypothetical protein
MNSKQTIPTTCTVARRGRETRIFVCSLFAATRQTTSQNRRGSRSVVKVGVAAARALLGCSPHTAAPFAVGGSVEARRPVACGRALVALFGDARADVVGCWRCFRVFCLGKPAPCPASPRALWSLCARGSQREACGERGVPKRASCCFFAFFVAWAEASRAWGGVQRCLFRRLARLACSASSFFVAFVVFLRNDPCAGECPVVVLCARTRLLTINAPLVGMMRLALLLVALCAVAYSLEAEKAKEASAFVAEEAAVKVCGLLSCLFVCLFVCLFAVTLLPLILLVFLSSLGRREGCGSWRL